MKEFEFQKSVCCEQFPGGGADSSLKRKCCMDRVYKRISGVLLSIIALAGGANYAAANDTRPVAADPIDNYNGTIDSVSDTIFRDFGTAIRNFGTINKIDNVLIENNNRGINNSGGDIDSINNVVIQNNSYGGLIHSGDMGHSYVGSITNVQFINNSGMGAIFNEGSDIKQIKGDFIGNRSDRHGGAIYNTGYDSGNSYIDLIFNSTFTHNETKGYGGAIVNMGDSYGNNTAIIDIISNTVFKENFVTVGTDYHIGENVARGGAIANINKAELSLILNSSFIGNYAKSENPDVKALGGAIYTDNDLVISADSGNTVFKDNYVQNGEVKDSSAIYAGNHDFGSFYDDELGFYVGEITSPNITLSATNGGTILIDDKIEGDVSQGSRYKSDYDENGNPIIIYLDDDTVTYTIAVEGDSRSKVVLNNDVNNGNVTLTGTNLYLGRENVLDNVVSFTVNSGSLNLVNDSVGTMHVPVFNLAGTTNLAVDVDLAAKSMDRITADKYNVTNGAYLRVNQLNLLSDAAQDKTSILFADSAYAKNVAYTGANPVAYSPIYKYDVSYNPNDGFFTFMRGASGGANPSDNYNPAVLPTPVTTQAGAYTTQLQTFNYAFQHVDTFMALPYLERMAIRNQNRYALSPTSDATDVGVFSPLFTKSEYSGFWVKPYSSFENIPLKNGPKVSNINYGTLIGYDSQLQSIKHGIDRVLTGYIGYNGASQRFQGVDSYQNGGILGGTVTLYKGNFFNATTLSVGATAGTNSGMYGSEDYTMLLAGVGNKFGYNYEMFKSKLILQPSMLISYTFVNTFDYKNAAGVKINSDPLNALQLAPGIKLIGNLENGWQPYLAVNMVWNILDKTKVMADDVRLPSMSIKPYVEYGAGIQKRWAKDYTAYLQAMVRNGGRNGVSLTAGFRWAVGKK